MNYLFTNILLLISLLQVDAQVSIGLKGGVNYSVFTDKNHIGLISEIKEFDSDQFEIERGITFSSIVQINFNKYFAIVIEPGMTRRNGIFVPDLWPEIDFIGPLDEANRIYLEVPFKFKMSVPLFKSKFGVYSTVGISPEKFLYIKFKNPSNGFPPLAGSDSIFEDWAVNRVLGIGFDVNFGLHRLFVESDFSVKMKNNNFNDNRLKDVALGIGYLYEI